MSLTSQLYTTDADHIYYDLNIINSNATYAPVKLAFSEVRTTPFLDNPQDFYCSIVRFELATPSLPVFVPQILNGQADINKMVYTFTLTDGVNTIQQNVQYIPSIQYPILIQPPLISQDMTTKYYYVYSYQLICNMFNDTLKSITTALNPALYPPFFTYDTSTSLFAINMPCSALGIPVFGIFCNTPVQILFSTFPFNYFGLTAPILGQNYEFVPIDAQLSNLITIGANTYLKIVQETSTTGSLNPISSIVFTSDTLPIVATLVGAPTLPHSNVGLLSAGNNSNFSNVLTDFIVSFSNGQSYKPTIEYTPSSEYRLISMYGSTALTDIDLQVFWKDRYSNLYPFFLDHGCFASLKILFRNKRFNGL